jgi:outer membrane protein OmpA-like peptidoglycan-associated protein
MITLIVDESAGTDTLWARNLATVNELQGKRLAVEMGGSSEYFALYMLNTLQLKPGVDAQLQTYDFLDDAIQAFNSGQADAVSGWEPTIFAAKEGGGKPLVSTRDFRAIVDVVVTSPRDITERTAVVQSFHNAWFDALNLQSSDFPRAAALLAGWGNNEWTGISVANAESDWREQLTTIAQASLAQNTLVMRQPESLAARLDEARLIWTNAGKQLAGGVATTRVEPQFVLRAAREFVAQGKPDRGTFPNMSFSLSGADVLAQAIPVIGEADAGAQATPTAAPVPAATAAPTAEPTAVPTVAITETPLAAAATREGASVIAVLPCKRFDFIPETTTLTPEASALLDQCVLRTLQRTVNVYIRVQGSAAWPGPPGTFKREDIQAFAQARSQAIVDYLTAKGVNRGRFIVEAVLPPESHWETEELTLQAQDRYVEVSLVSGGR